MLPVSLLQIAPSHRTRWTIDSTSLILAISVQVTGDEH